MNVTITKVKTESFYDTEPGTTIKVWATLDEPIKHPEERFHDRVVRKPDEVTGVVFEVYSDEHHEFKPLRVGSTWLSPRGYVLTQKGTRNKTTGYGRLNRDLSATEEAAIIAALQRAEHLPGELRDPARV